MGKGLVYVALAKTLVNLLTRFGVGGIYHWNASYTITTQKDEYYMPWLIRRYRGSMALLRHIGGSSEVM